MSAQRLSRLNDGMSALTMGAPLTGLFEGEGEASTTSFALAFLIVAMRVKFWIDDMDFFEDPAKGGDRSDFVFRCGVALALISWVLFIVAGISVRDPAMAAVWLAAALFASTLWLALEVWGVKSYPAQAVWSWTNLGYLILCAVLFRSVDVAAFTGLTVTTVQTATIAVFALVLGVDIFRSEWLQTAKAKLVRELDEADLAARARKARPILGRLVLIVLVMALLFLVG